MNLVEQILRIHEMIENLSEMKENHDGWKNTNQRLEKTFNFKNYDQTMDFVDKVAKIAKKQNHHPDLMVSYDKVKISITDHEKGGVSEKCYKFVEAVNNITSEKEEDSAKWIKCKNCKHKFTQTIHKGKKSFPICPTCGTHNKEEDY